MTNISNVYVLDQLVAAVKKAQTAKENHPEILTTDEVLEYVRISHATMYRLMSLDLFPKPIKLGLRKNGWYRSDIDSWLANRARVAA